MEERDDVLMYVIWAKHLGYATHIHKFLFWVCLDSGQASHVTVVLGSRKDSVTICCFKQSQYLPSLNLLSSLPCRWELIITVYNKLHTTKSWTQLMNRSFQCPWFGQLNWSQQLKHHRWVRRSTRKSSILISFIYRRTCYLLSPIGTEISQALACI